ncbi:MAG: hypothetical protein WC868_03470 [Bacteroidales bacterium]
MVVVETAILIASLYLGDKILEHIIQEEIWTKRILHKIFPPLTYKKHLVAIINKTIDEFEKNNPYDNSNGMFPFYHSQMFFEHLSMFILFNKGSLETINVDFKQFPKIIRPTRKNLIDFYNLFYLYASADSKLKKLFIEENYKSQIFKVTEIIEDIKETVDSIRKETTITKERIEELIVQKEKKKLTIQKTIDALNDQVSRQLGKQINSGKYLRNTFIETGNQKDHLRYLCDSVFYSEKCFDEIRILDFRYLDNFLKSKKHHGFDFDFEKIKLDKVSLNISNSSKLINEWLNYLEKKRQEIVDIKIASNEKSKFEYKFRDRIEDLYFLKSKVAIITEAAGQGKTNFLCDFAENFLIRREIPTVFLTGAEINATDIRQSFLKRIFPDSADYSFDELLAILKTYCHEQNKFFIIIIDGINENLVPILLSQNIETFVSDLQKHDFIRIVISCRTEYYQHNFINLEKSSFSNDLKQITSLRINHNDNDLNEKLFDIYFYHFNIKYNRISKKAYNQLVSNFLLLRIFCETYQNQRFDFIDNIYKEELFKRYYSLKSEEINKHLISNDEFKIKGTFDIKNFISNIVDFMIQNKVYINVPLDNIIEVPEYREMYVRFLDENILIKRDIQADEKGIFTSAEVVNFTFDEFRDFLISRYLIEILYKKSQSDFVSFIESEITKKSTLLEGCSTFLFFISRKCSDKYLKDIISIQSWFEAVFSRCIFSINNSQITENDKKMLGDILRKDIVPNNSIVYNLIYRYDITHYNKLNIDFLFELLSEFDEQQYEKCFVSEFGDDQWAHSQINQESLLNQINKIIDKRELNDNSSEHKRFELLIYMFTNKNDWEIQSIYKRYYFQHSDKGKEQLRKALESRNQKLVAKIKQFVENYEISL